MHGFSRLGSPSSTSSPPTSPRCRHARTKSFTPSSNTPVNTISIPHVSKPRLFDKVLFFIVSAVFRRRGVLLLAPLLYISGMMLYMGSFNFDIVNLKNAVVVHRPAPPGSVYRSPQVFENLWPFMQSESGNFSQNVISSVWNSKIHHDWKPCMNDINESATNAELSKSNGFLIIEANGGLNQQRLSICDAVAVAGLMNATLVIPIFHLNSVWQDSSKFRDIFDEEFFIDILKNHVKIVRELPTDVLLRFDNNISSIVNLRVKGWSSTTYYLQKVLPKLEQLEAVRIAPFSNRLAHVVPSHVQRLRCVSNFEALRFSESIRTLADQMVNRMVKKSSAIGGKYVSVHLRFEEDMVAFSCCEYDGGEEEKREMEIARERGWKGKFRRRGRVIRPGQNRVDGKCPLTPLEVGMMLRGMGFDNTTSIYVAAGKIYNAERYMAPLKQMFPHLETKETLASEEELSLFKGHLSRLAALDYTVCLRSEVFVTTQGGNFPHFLMGHRRYIYGGHAKTLKPDKRKLAIIFDKPSIRWKDFQRQMRDMLRHNDKKGMEMKKSSASLYTFPMPDCMCKEPNTEAAKYNLTSHLF